MTQDECVKRIEQAKTYNEYVKVTIDLKKAHGGLYPDWWFKAIMSSGLYKRVSAAWPDVHGNRTTAAAQLNELFPNTTVFDLDP